MSEKAYNIEAVEVPNILRDVYNSVIREHVDNPNFEVYNKGSNDLVTDCDIKAEEMIKRRIFELFPEDGFIAEELNSEAKENYRTWVLDPIDGTVNFSSGIKLFGIQIALLEEGQPVFSAIYLPCQNEMYVAIKGKGVTLNGRPVKVSAGAELRTSLITFGDFSTKSNTVRNAQIYAFNQLYNQVRKMKMFGAACVDFTYLASGKTQAHVIFTSNIWDFMPGYFMALEAGAYTNFDINHPSQYIVCAANESLLNSILDTVGNVEV